MKEVKKRKTTKILINLLSITFIIAASILIFEKFDQENILLEDSKKFASLYKDVPENNNFTFSSSSEVLKILEDGTGIIFFGYPECNWCQAYVKILNEAATKEDINKIYYLDVKNDREKNSQEYKKIISLLKNHLYFDDENNYRIYVPDVTFVKNGKIIGHDNETSLVTKEDGTPNEYWTNEKKEYLETRLITFMKELKK